jgi:hypothetical protein
VKNPRYNVGIVKGKLYNLVVLDVDPQHGGDESLDKLKQQHGSLPQTVECVTIGTRGQGHALISSLQSP